MVIFLEQGADLHMAQLMPLPLTVSCFSKIQTCFTFLILAHLCSPGKGAVGRVYVCMLCQNLYLLQWTFVVTVCWCSSRLPYQSNSRVISHSFVRLIVERTTSRKHGTPKPVPPPTAAQFPRYLITCFTLIFCLQCSDTVGWAAGRASGL